MANPEPSKRYPLVVQTTYAELLARLEEDAVLNIHGSHVLRTRDRRKYWYTVRRLGDRTIERYLGPDTEETRAAIDRAKTAKGDLRRRERERASLVRACREGGLPSVDAATGKVLLALAKAGLFRLRAVLVGTHAFRCYPAVLGVDIPESRAVTEDIDVAVFRSISVALEDQLDPSLGEALRLIGSFQPRPTMHRQATAWRDRDSGVVVELLTPNEGPDTDAPVELPNLGAWATPLRFLDYLIQRPMVAVVLYRSGVLVNVPRPAPYAVHKLIVAARRVVGADAKARKDIEQAAALIGILAADQPDEIGAAFVEARGRGPAWRKAIEAGMRRLPADSREALEDVLDQEASRREDGTLKPRAPRAAPGGVRRRNDRRRR
jgi:hypothetical protein